MKIINILPILLVVPSIVYGAGRGDTSVRVGMGRGSQAGARMTITALDVQNAIEQGTAANAEETTASVDVVAVEKTSNAVAQSAPVVSNVSTSVSSSSGDCRDAYRECMDNFCLLDESQGERCACSDNIEAAKSKIKAVLAIQAEADKLYTEGVEREQLGAKAKLVFARRSK